MAKLAALEPKPRVNLTRYHGVFAPNSKHRINVTPAKRGKGSAKKLKAKNKKNAELLVSEIFFAIVLMTLARPIQDIAAHRKENTCDAPGVSVYRYRITK